MSNYKVAMPFLLQALTKFLAPASNTLSNDKSVLYLNATTETTALRDYSAENKNMP